MDGEQGDRMRLWKKSPKNAAQPFLVKTNT
jgi:hypothetical protein